MSGSFLKSFIAKRHELKATGLGPRWWDRIFALLLVIGVVLANERFHFYKVLIVCAPVAVVYVFIRWQILRRRLSRIQT